MSLQELKEKAYQLSVSDHLALISAVIQSLRNAFQIEWQYLVSCPHPWRKQLYIKGHKLLASTFWRNMVTNQLSPEQAVEKWDLPLAAICDILQYYESHQELLKLEADEERYRLEVKGVLFKPTNIA
ncbi:hypothetical protein [Gloeocapsopsis sp. IPPAS B-1203]|uniref:hypothetical protein n=1 Tax=Gloeocapsopsis sp. IPPAS B-1203 TaxID=2049454 RepID=UPI000C178FFA|nr:hypothetical protein [Gloeocapsopsis sp. IPPAS B-1203]PIG94341.1 hypothetical protein CSQ79_03320 [Gloeocapsopsis sp. IPPAS B-1203]